MKAAEATEKSGLWQVPVAQIKRLDGYNVRIQTPDYEAHVEALAASIAANGFYANKPLAGYVAKEDGENIIYITDGYSRLSAVELAIERGAEIERLPVILKPQTENLIDLTVALDQDNAGRPLTVFERAIVVKRLISFGAEPAEIATRLNITERYVSDLVVLAGAPAKVRQLLISGKIAPTEAIKQLRKNPEKAGDTLTAAVAAAAAEGKSKASAKHVADDGEDDENKNVSVTTKVTKGKQLDKAVYRLKGGEKVRKGLLESILNVDGGAWWREAEDLDDAQEGDVIITQTIEITIVVKKDPPEGETDSGDAPTDEEVDSALGDDDGDDGTAREDAGDGEPDADDASDL